MRSTIKRTFIAFNQFIKKKNISRDDLAILFRQLATLIKAGIPIMTSCEILANSQTNLTLQTLLDAIKQDIFAGKKFYYCLSLHHKVIDVMSCQLVQIGEETGTLDQMLHRIASHYEKERLLKMRIKRAFFYPGVVCLTSGFIITITVMFIIPQFSELFATSNMPLSGLSRWLFLLARKEIQVYLLGFILFFVSLFFFLRHSIQQWLISTFPYLPFIKRSWHKIILSRFTRQLAITLHSGIPISDSLKLIASQPATPAYLEILLVLRQQVRGGLQLHQAMSLQPFFPRTTIQMVKIGEESGMLSEMLANVADLLEADIEDLISRLCLLLEPCIIIFLGLLIGLIVMGIYLPIFNLGNAF